MCCAALTPYVLRSRAQSSVLAHVIVTCSLTCAHGLALGRSRPYSQTSAHFLLLPLLMQQRVSHHTPYGAFAP
ncbi:hypothetical protein QBC32DRAFT_356370 [Pseudoneurospora amorphoporcata]|uniref:Uncharacterized protein n=1 Tax=Pseudoneurospora amorphoporcata TaxID=241081 RepID=A0AAN6NJ90_9PEZI|nr:hypothetical protein QBC32DRAFT_356370 [Pseudoneurospora amorphoporcata]